jgi:hypothetical protein
VSRLPDIYRAVIVLCDLEGRTRKEVARQLGVPEGTVAGRLARARAMLAKRLTQRGVTLTGEALAAVLAQNVASAGVPDSVASATISAASYYMAGQVAETTGAISVKVVALTEGVLKAMRMSKLKALMAVVLVLGFMVTGATVLCCRTASAQGNQPPAVENPVKAPQKQKKEMEGFTTWGKEINGLQAGLGFRPGEKRAYIHGETVRLVVRVRNVGKEGVKFHFLRQFFIEALPAVTDGEGKRVPQPRYEVSGLVHVPVEVSLAPGKAIELAALKLELRPASERGNNRFTTLYGTGKVQLQYERVFGNTAAGQIRLDPNLSKLATGKLELEIKSDPPAATEKK